MDTWVQYYGYLVLLWVPGSSTMGTWDQHYGYLGSRAHEYLAALADLSQLQLQDEVEKTWNTKDSMDARVQDFQPLHYRKVSIMGGGTFALH